MFCHVECKSAFWWWNKCILKIRVTFYFLCWHTLCWCLCVVIDVCHYVWRVCVCVHVLRLCCAKLLHQFCLCTKSSLFIVLPTWSTWDSPEGKSSSLWGLIACSGTTRRRADNCMYTCINVKICFIACCCIVVALQDKQHAITHIRDYCTQHILSSNGI